MQLAVGYHRPRIRFGAKISSVQIVEGKIGQKIGQNPPIVHLFILE